MIRRATYEDLPQLVNILRQAFDANPAVNDTIRNDDQRDKRAFALMEYIIKTDYCTKECISIRKRIVPQ
jgi:hypothetical protein